MKNLGLPQKILMLVALSLPLAAGCSKTPEQSDTKPAGQAAAGWKILGPGGGGAVYGATVNPSDPDHAFVRCDMTCAFVTEDGGKSWRTFNLRTVIADFEFDPNQPNTVYASNTGLYRSEDRGKRWRLIYPDPQDVVAELTLSDHADHVLETAGGVPGRIIDKVRVDPADSRRIYISLGAPYHFDNVSRPLPESDSTRILVSTDRGANWKVLARLASGKVLAIFPGSWDDNPDEITVFTQRAALRISTSSGKVTPLPLPVEQIRAVDGGRGKEGAILYLLAEMQQDDNRVLGGIYRSTDGGQHWAQVNNNLLADLPVTGELPRFVTLAVCEGRPEVVYLSCSSYPTRVEGKPEQHFGTLKTDSAGEQWHWVYRSNEDSILTNNYSGYWKERSYGVGWAGAPNAYGISPTDPDVCYVTDNRTFRTTDGGGHWEQLGSIDLPDGSATTRGIEGTGTYGVHFDPFDEQHFCVTYSDFGLFQTFNGGRSWVHAIKGIPLDWRNTCYGVAFDPQVKGRAWSVWSNAHDLPRHKMFRSGQLGRRKGGVAVSQDGCLSWQVSNQGLPENTVPTHILLDPTSPVESRTLYVSAFGKGVFKSTDGGKTWREASNGLGVNRNAWRMVRLPSGRLYLVVFRNVVNKALVDGVLYRSDDGAASWSVVPLPAGVNGPSDLAFDPDTPRRMYLSCWPRLIDRVETGGGLFRTEDGGETWQRVFDGQAHVFAAAVDPRRPSTVFINTFDFAAFRSDDRGDTWYKLEGYNFKWGHRPIPDPHNPEMLYLTTLGGSLYYGPAKGVPGAFEDIEPYPAMRWRNLIR